MSVSMAKPRHCTQRVGKERKGQFDSLTRLVGAFDSPDSPAKTGGSSCPTLPAVHVVRLRAFGEPGSTDNLAGGFSEGTIRNIPRGS